MTTTNTKIITGVSVDKKTGELRATTKPKIIPEKTGVSVDKKTGELRETQVAKIVKDSFAASTETHATVAKVMKDTLKHAKLNWKHEQGDVRALTLASTKLLTERTEAKAVVELSVLQASLYEIAGFAPNTLEKNIRAKVGMRVTRATRAAMLAFDRTGFQLDDVGDLQVWECINNPEKDKLDKFEKVIGKVKNTSKKFEPVNQTSIADHYGEQYPGSVNKKGTNNVQTKAIEAAQLYSSYESMTCEYLIATLTGANAKGKMPKVKNLTPAILKRCIELMTAINGYRAFAIGQNLDGPLALFKDALDNIDNNDPSAVANTG